MDSWYVPILLYTCPTFCTERLSIANISVCIFPIDVMPIFFRYGYAAPLYNISRGMRTIIFGTKNSSEYLLTKKNNQNVAQFLFPLLFKLDCPLGLSSLGQLFLASVSPSSSGLCAGDHINHRLDSKIRLCLKHSRIIIHFYFFIIRLI